MNPTPQHNNTNLAGWERWTSTLAGSALVAYGLVRRDKRGAGLALVGGGLLYRGATGHCPAYEKMGVSTAPADSPERAAKPTANSGKAVRGPKGVQNEQGIKVKKSITINKTPEELYAYWRDFDNLPRFMQHLKSVTVTGERASHWVAKAPWDAPSSGTLKSLMKSRTS